MARKAMTAVCLAVSLALRLYALAHGHATERSLLAEPVVIAWVAYLLPAMLPVLAIEWLGFHYAPWADGHAGTTTLCLTLIASLIWFFPAARVARRFGVFDGLQNGKRRRAVFTRSAASMFDMLNKRLFGRQKTGGWA